MPQAKDDHSSTESEQGGIKPLINGSVEVSWYDFMLEWKPKVKTQGVPGDKVATQTAVPFRIGNDVENLATLKVEDQEILLPRMSTSLRTNSLAVITAALVANEKHLQDDRISVILSIYCGLYNIYLEFTDIPPINRYLVKLGYRLNEVTIEEWTSWVSLKRKGVSQIVAHYLSETDDILHKLAWTLLGPLLCLLGHKPVESNHQYWGNKILRASCIPTNLPEELHDTLFYPSLEFCRRTTKILDEMCEVKRHMFYTVYNTASMIPSLPGAICRLIVELLRGVGLLDFILIDHFLLIQNPFALLLNSIAENAGILLTAYEKYMEYGHLAPWCTIIAAPEDLCIFRDPRLKAITAVAKGLAVKNGLTLLENYYPAEETKDILFTIEKADQLFKQTVIKKKEQKQDPKDV